MAKFQIDTGRQWPLMALQALNFDELTSGKAEVAVKLPPGALVLSSSLNVTTAYNGGAAKVDVTDDSAVPLAYFAGASLAAAATIDAGEGVIGKFYPAGGVLTMTPTIGAPTTGVAYLAVMYVIAGRATENQAR